MVAFGIRRPLHKALTRDRAAPFVRSPAGGGALRWIFPVLCLAAPFLGEVAVIYLPSCLLFGAVLGIWGAHRTGAVWSVMIWSLVTGVFGALLAFVEVQVVPDLRILALVTALIQALALLAIGAPATISGWPARGMVLASLAGPLALALLALRGAPAWAALAATLAVALDLAGLPLALMARRRARP